MPFDTYDVLLCSGKRFQILAASDEDAAWVADSFARDMDDQLEDVRKSNE